MKTKINALRVQFALLFVVLLAGGTGLAPAAVTNIWNAPGPDGFWTNSANWTNLAGVATVPATNDVLVFTGSTQVNSTNNYTNAAASLIFSGIIFDQNAGAFNLYGNTITPGGGFTNNSASTETVFLPVAVSGGPASTPRPFDVIPAGGNLVFNGVISGATNLTLTGSGTVTLNATNTFTGALNVAGTLTIGNSGELGSGTYAGAITNNGTITYTGLNAQTLSGLISNSAAGIINLNGAVGQTLSGTVTNNGAISVGSGTPTLSGTFANNGSITFDTTNAATLSGTLIGAGSVTQNGVNTLTISGNSPGYTGAVAINAGELISTTGSLNGGAVTVASGATNAVQVTASGGQATLGSLTYAAGTTYLAVSTSQAFSPSYAPLQVNGNVAFNGTLNIIVTTNGSVPLSAGAFPLIKYTGTVSGTPPTTPFALPTGMVANIVNNTANHSIDLDITAGGNQVSWAVGSGAWDFSTPNWTMKSPSQPNFSVPNTEYSDGEFAVFEDVLSGASPITITLNTTVMPTNVLFNNTVKSYTLAGTGAISGPTGLTQEGGNSVTLSTPQAYTGATTLDNGTMNLNYATSTSPIISSSSVLVLADGALNMVGSTAGFNDQPFANTTFNAGSSTVTVSGPQVPEVDLGALTYNTGSTVVFNGPAYSVAPTTAAGQTGSAGNPDPVTGLSNATANITTTSGSTAAPQLVGNATGVSPGTGTAAYAAFATVGLYDYAAVTGASPYTIIGASESSVATGTSAGANGSDGAYTLVVSGNTGGTSGSTGGPFDLVGACSGHNTDNISAVRFNANQVSSMNGAAGTTQVGGILVTPNVGAFNTTASGLNAGLRSGSAAGSIVIWQNNTNGFLNVFGLNDGKVAGAAIVQAGAGTVNYTAPANHTGPTYLNGGVTEIYSDLALGSNNTIETLFLNGGTVLAGATMALDNGGVGQRPIVLGFTGGGLAAVGNLSFTVDGVITGTTGTGPLAIGIPASSANGNVLGVVPGTGAGTANPVPTNATGLVILTGVNTYTGGTVVYSGGVRFNTGTLGSGAVTLNGGTLQWSSGSAIDITGTQGLIIGPNGGTLDLNGNNVTLANPITGTGALTVTNGTLTLTAANTFAGGMTVGSGSTLIMANSTGSATGSGPVVVQTGGTLTGSGSFTGSITVDRNGNFNPGQNSGTGNTTVGSLSLGPGGTFTTPGANFTLNFSGSGNNEIIVANSGGLVLNGGALNLNTAGTLFSYGVAGTYNLIQYSGAIGGTGLDSTWTTVSADNPHVANPQVGFKYSFGATGSQLQVAVVVDPTAINATWITDANGNWSSAVNWNSNPNIPDVAGSAATFGIETAERTVTLDQNETVGVINFTNTDSFIVANAGNTLTLDKLGDGAKVNVEAGTGNAIQTAIALNDSGEFIFGSNMSLTLSGAIANSSATAEVLSATGPGTLGLSGTNSYGPAAGTFGTVLGVGVTLQVGSSGALGAGDLEFVANNTLQAGASGINLPNNIDLPASVIGTFDSAGNSFTLSGIISDNGAVTKINPGIVNLTGPNTYTGGTTIKGGAIGISVDGNLGAVSPVNFNGGGLFTLAAVSTVTNRNFLIGPPSGNTGTNAFLDAGAGGALTVLGSIAPAGNLGLDGLVVNSLSGSTGTVYLEGPGSFTGVTSVANGILQLVGNANSALPADNESLAGSTFANNPGGALLFDTTVFTATLGGLSGNQPFALTNDTGTPITLSVGANNISNRFLGGFYDSELGGILNKNGSATFTLAGSNNFTGRLTVNNGTLELAAGGVLNIGTFAGQGYLVDGGILTNATTTVNSLNQVANAFLETAGTVTIGELTEANNDGILFEITGGTFSSPYVRLLRANNYAAPTAAAPVAALTTIGLYIDSTNTLQPAQVDLGQLTIADTAANSSSSMRMDAGSLTVTNAVTVGNQGATVGRWDILQINGGRFTNLDTVNGLVIANNLVSQNDAFVYLSGGSNFVQLINFGTVNDTFPGIGDLLINNSTLFVGSGGINCPSLLGTYVPSLWLESGTLGATADWSSSITANGANTGWTLPTATTFTIQAGDANNNPFNITLTGGMSGTGSLAKTGGGILTLSGTNNWSGTTTISAGTLALTDTPNPSMLTSPTISIASGATLDVSGTTYNLSGQTLEGSGTVNGSVNAVAGDKVYAGLPAAYGTNTFNNNLTLGPGVTAYLALGLTNTGAATRSNGLFVVTGNLTLDGNSIHITAPNTSNNLDNATAYVLFNVTGTISGEASSTPIWDVRPTNAANYNVVTLAHSVVLQYYPSSSLPPTGVASVSPVNLYEDETATVTATVTNGGNPSIASVVLNETALGGSSAVAMTFVSSPSAGVSNYSVSINIPASFTPGAQTLSVIVTDGAGEVAALPVAFTVFPGRYWTGGGADNNWSTSANWLGGLAPNPAGDSITFAGTTRLDPVMDQYYTLAGFAFDMTAGSFNVTNNNTAITLGGGVTNNSTATETVNIPITLSAPSALSASSGNLVFGQTLDNGGVLLTITGSNSTTVSGVIQDSGGLTFTGPSNLNLLNQNTYNGNTVVSAGTVTLGPNGLLGGATYTGTIALTATNSVLTYNGTNTQTLIGVISGAGAFNAIGLVMPPAPYTNGEVILTGGNTFTGNIVISNAYVSDQNLENAAATTASGLGNPQTAGRTVTINNNGVLSLDNTTSPAGNEFGSGASAPVFAFIVNQGGLMQITDGNTTVGPLTLNGGTLICDNNSASASGTEYEPFELGSTVTVGGTVPSLITNISDSTISGVNLGVALTTGQTTFTVNATGSASPDLTVAVPMVDAGGEVVGTSVRGFIKAGTGRMALTDQNLYHGATTLSNGTVTLGSAENVGVSGPLGTSTANNSNSIIFSGGILQYSGVNQSDYSGRFGITAGQLYKIDTAGQPVTFASPLASTTGTLTKIGAGTLTINAAAAYTGATTVSNGTLALGASGSLTAASSVSISPNAIFDVSAKGSYTIGTSATLTASGSSATPATINGNVSLGSRPITLAYSGTSALNITGGALTLTGNAFTVNGTALAVSATPYVLVQAGSAITASGSFTVAGTALAVGTMGVITVSGNQVLLTVSEQTPPQLNFTATGVSSLQFTWPAAYLGYTLQSNSINIGVNADWFTVAGSSTVTNVTIPVRSTNATVFFRLEQ